MELHDFQEKAIGDLAVKVGVDGIKRTLLQLATGGGKTVMFSGLIKRFLDKQITQRQRVVVLVHRMELLQQARATIYKWYGIVAQPLTKEVKYLPPAQIYVCMAETANKRLQSNPSYFGDVGLCIVDEAHIGNFKKLLSYFTCPLIGFTATPISSSKKDPLKNYYQDIVTCIDIPELIERGFLTRNITYHIKNVTVALKVKGGEYDMEFMANEYKKTKHVHNTVEAYEQKCNGKKALVFNCNVEHSLMVRDAFIAAGHPCMHVDGDMDDRADVIQWFRQTPGAIVCSIGVLTTGFDEPTIEAIIMNRKTKSIPLWLQCCGRGSRKYPGKDYFLILDLGDNAKQHGNWNAERDWRDLFFNPDKPSTKEAVAPVRECEMCGALIPASARVCEYCGHERKLDIKIDGNPLELELFQDVRFTVKSIIDRNENDGRTEYNALHLMKSMLVHEVRKNGVTELDDAMASQLIELYHRKVKEWCAIKGKRYGGWFATEPTKWFLEYLKKVYGYVPTLSMESVEN